MEYEKGTLPWLLRTYYSQLIGNILQKIDGNKDLIISQELIQPLDLVCSYSSLKMNGVVKIYSLQDGAPPGSTENRCYLTRNDAHSTKVIANHINANVAQQYTNIKYSIIYIPKKHAICEQILEEEGVFGYIRIFEYPLCLIPIDCDLFSCENITCFKDLYLNMDYSSLSYISTLIVQLQSLVGNIQKIHTLGKYSKMAVKLSEYNSEETTADDGFITDLIVIDRDVDYPSVLLSQLTYEGLLDEIFGIKCGKITLPGDVVKDEELKGGTVIAHSSDPVYSDIRDYHLSATFARLKQKMQQLKTKQSERKEMDLTAIKGFVANELQSVRSQHRSISLHISISEFVLEKKKEKEFVEQLQVENNLLLGHDIKECINHIEEGIIRQFSPTESLRLLCLLSLSEEGLSSKDYKHVVKQFFQSYGHQLIVSVLNLKKLGLLLEQRTNNALTSPMSGGASNMLLNTKVAAAISAFPRKSHFRSLIKRLNLIPVAPESGYNLLNPVDSGFVFGGVYIPLICRLLETLFSNSDQNNKEFLKLFPGDYWCKTTHRRRNVTDKVKAVCVCFVGGVTFAEIAALRFLAVQKGIQIIITCSSLINGNVMMKQIGPESQ